MCGRPLALQACHRLLLQSACEEHVVACCCETLIKLYSYNRRLGSGTAEICAVRAALCRWAAWKAEGCGSYEKRTPVELQPLPARKLAPRKARPHGRVDVGVPAINR